MSDIDELEELAEQLASLRARQNYHPSIDGKLAEAEVNLRGVAGMLFDGEGRR